MSSPFIKFAANFDDMADDDEQKLHDVQEHNLFTCDQCCNKYKRKGDLVHHIREMHEGFKPYTCKLCSHSFSKPSKLKDHVNSVHEKIKKYRCDQCSYGSYLRAPLLTHYKNVHEGFKPLSCDQCSYKACSRRRLRDHVRLIHEKCERSFHCSKCKYSATTQNTLNMHMKFKHSNVREHQCPQCAYKATLKQTLNKHILCVHVKTDKKFTCSQCSFKTATKQALDNHIAVIHNSGRPFKCSQCSYAGKLKFYLNQHIARVHQMPLPKKYKCEHCNFISSHRTSLINHMSLHSDEFKYVCEICDFKTKRKYGLIRHNEHVHLKIKRHACDQCSYATNDVRYLRKHKKSNHAVFDSEAGPGTILRHDKVLETEIVDISNDLNVKCDTDKVTDEFKCKHCKKRFAASKNLKEHILRRHELLRPFECKHCEHRSFKAYLMKNHIIAKHNDLKGDMETQYIDTRKSSSTDKFQCEKCEFSSDFYVGLTRHISLKHEKLPKVKRPLLYCDSCDFKTKMRAKLNKHMKDIHQNYELNCKKSFYVESKHKSNESFDCYTSSNLFKQNCKNINLFEKSDHFNENHQKRIENLCRTCAIKTEKSIPVMEYFPELLVLSNIDISKDDPDIHPQKLCEFCCDKLKSRYSFSAVDFKPHTESCKICFLN